MIGFCQVYTWGHTTSGRSYAHQVMQKQLEWKQLIPPGTGAMQCHGLSYVQHTSVQ